MRIALIVGLAPRKLGSLEDWLVGLARGAAARSHQLDLFGLEPILHQVRSALEGHGATWGRVEDLAKSPVRAVRSLRQYDVIHLNFFGVGSRIALLAFASAPVPIVYVDHFSKREVRGSLPARIRRRVLGQLARSRLSAAIGVSDFTRLHMTSLLGLDPDRTLTVYNGVRLERFEPRPAGLDANRPIGVLAVANLIPEKGIDGLIKAVARFDSIRLRIIGEGPEKDRLLALSSSLGIADRTEFLGLRNDVEHFLEDCDIFVHPAIWTEAFGLTVAEAMAAGRPVVASRIGAIPELLEDGRTGLLVPAGDESALAAALDRLATDPSLRRELGENARRRAEEVFSLDRCVEQHLNVCERVAKLDA